MNGKIKGATPIEATPTKDIANIANNPEKEKDLARVLEYFRYKVGTSLDCAISTKILRNSVTWYIAMLEDMGLLMAVKVGKDKTTGFHAKFYSADQNEWPSHKWVQLNLWGE